MKIEKYEMTSITNPTTNCKTFSSLTHTNHLLSLKKPINMHQIE